MQIARIAAVATLAAFSLVPSTALAAPDRSGSVSDAAATYEWDGAMATGYNTERDAQACSHDVQTYCDLTLVKVDAPAGATGELKFTTDGYFGPQCTPIDGQNAPCDFSLWVYQSDASGKVGKNVGSSINDSGEAEEVTVKKAAAGYYLAVVYYYTVAQSSYQGTATLSKLTLPAVAAPAPAAAPTVSAPPAPLQAKLALAKPTRPGRSALGALVTCTVACKGTVTAEITAGQARKLGLGRRKMVLARATVSATAPGTPARVALKLSRRVAARLARARTVRIILRAAITGAADGQKTSAVHTITLRQR